MSRKVCVWDPTPLEAIILPALVLYNISQLVGWQWARTNRRVLNSDGGRRVWIGEAQQPWPGPKSRVDHKTPPYPPLRFF